MSEIDHEYTKEIVCPHCGYEFIDSWEHNESLQSDQSGDNLISCHECEKNFVAHMDVEVYYSTSTLDNCEDCGNECIASTYMGDGERKRICSTCYYKRRHPEDFAGK